MLSKERKRNLRVVVQRLKNGGHNHMKFYSFSEEEYQYILKYLRGLKVEILSDKDFHFSSAESKHMNKDALEPNKQVRVLEIRFK